MEDDCIMVTSFQIASLKSRLEGLEKAVDEMERSERLVHDLAKQADRHMMSLDFEEGFCKECFYRFTNKLRHICGRIDETTERSGDLSMLSEELWADLEDRIFLTEEGVPCQGGHAK